MEEVENVISSPRKLWGEECELDVGELQEGSIKVANVHVEENGALHIVVNQNSVRELEMEGVDVDGEKDLGGNPGPSGGGMVLPNSKGLVLLAQSCYYGQGSNMTAECLALLDGSVLKPGDRMAKQDKKKKPRGRTHKHMQYNRRFVTAVVGFGKKRGPNSSEK
ncbi:unnamed protein product [Ilex paraguariensis]|uniref:40S ribosomal protein S30 n=1 Tax=Ilex paraguariensis TaxID=185542 RepID=A0ABC8TSB3_9AQUA